MNGAGASDDLSLFERGFALGEEQAWHDKRTGQETLCPFVLEMAAGWLAGYSGRYELGYLTIAERGVRRGGAGPFTYVPPQRPNPFGGVACS